MSNVSHHPLPQFLLGFVVTHDQPTVADRHITVKTRCTSLHSFTHSLFKTALSEPHVVQYSLMKPHVIQY